MKKIVQNLILFPVYTYRYIVKPFLPMSCRFTPSCSEYAIEAVHMCGPLTGLYKIVLRLLRCHPWCKGGYDPVLPCNLCEIEKK